MTAATQPAVPTKVPWPPTENDAWAEWRQKWEANERARKKMLATPVGQGWSASLYEQLQDEERCLLRDIVLGLALLPASSSKWRDYDRKRFQNLIAAARLACPGAVPPRP